MFDYIATICDLLIAAIGLFFTVRQIIFDSKAKAKEKIEEECCYELAKKSIEISGLIENIEKSTKVMEKATLDKIISQKILHESIKVNKSLYEAIHTAHDECEAIYFKCKEVKIDISNIYTNLLKNESMFSLSIGFDRIIDSCRPIVYEMDMHLNNFNAAFINLHGTTRKIGFDQCGYMTEEDAVALNNQLKNMIEVLNTILELLKKVYPMIKELEFKFTPEE